ncbi:DUF1491 family protein [Sphingomonas astaxanthinifaciens]|uniref:DUF1491 family protein n=1 Tax=Sphingomonas astaxanthinifaciens DSM 22298 TaxID=1123267 RepID=A0ABQ5Z7A3_9SPHN|nr:DUF1491 family protein [Sphingomonas astaxanthinifaciens]GLR46758.1 hypothetical protein GCM10007925_04690 [Sphingomonas astaxanthinifaciens DSM 22298]
MSEARLAPSIEVSALLAKARAEGGFGTVLARGDPDRGAIMVVLAERGEAKRLVERRLQTGGTYEWEGRESGDSANLQQHLARARDSDPDLWVIELDIPSTERFVAGMISGD